MAYMLTERRREAARENLKKAWEAHRAGRVPRPERPNNLKHGFFSLDLRKSVILLGGDVGEYDAHVARFEKALAPVTDRERRIVQRMAEAAWRLIRSYRARANAQARKLRRLMEFAARQAPLDPHQTKTLAVLSVKILSDEHYLLDCVTRLRNQFERLFRLLLTERTGSDQGFRIHSQKKFSKWDLAVPFK
ncbi:MAG: hypothetical protein ACE145_01560 [Terriglobia bacterium]